MEPKLPVSMRLSSFSSLISTLAAGKRKVPHYGDAVGKQRGSPVRPGLTDADDPLDALLALVLVVLLLGVELGQRLDQ